MSTLKTLLVASLLVLFVLGACAPLEIAEPPDAPLPDAAAPTPGPEWVVFNHETIEMPVAVTAYDFAMADPNVVWIGTSDGLARFGADGWTWYTTENSDLPHDRVTALALDGSENLWVGTHDGLARFDGENWDIFTTENSGLPYKSIHELAFDAEGLLWIGTGCFFCEGSGGMARFDGVDWQTYTFENSGLPSNHIIGLAIDDQGAKWIGTTGSLARFEGDTWTDFSGAEGSARLQGYDFPGISVDSAGEVWVSSGGSGGVVHFDGEAWTHYQESETPLPSRYAEEIFVDSQDTRWIGTREGLVKFDDSGWTIYDASNTDLPSNWIWAIDEDQYGNIWIGTNIGGMAVHREGGVLLP